MTVLLLVKVVAVSLIVGLGVAELFKLALRVVGRLLPVRI